MTLPARTMPVYYYGRVSSTEQADSGLGLAAQRLRVLAYCESRGLVVTEWFEDAGVSGGKPLASRPEGARMLKAMKKAKHGAMVVAAKLDRLFRSVADAATTINEWDKQGIAMVAVQEGFDMSSSYGRAMAQMAAVFAELERSMIRERTKSALAVKRGRGERVSRHAPYGWDFTEAGMLVENAVEQEGRALILSLRQQGMTFRAIAAELDRRSIGTKHGGKRWSFVSVEGVVKYTGGAVVLPVEATAKEVLR